MNTTASASHVAIRDVGLNSEALDQLCVNPIRTLAMDAVQEANSGHPGTPMALAPVVYCLWQIALLAYLEMNDADEAVLQQMVHDGETESEACCGNNEAGNGC